MSWQADKKWADDFVPAMQVVLAENAGRFVTWELVDASAEDDLKKCTDYLFRADTARIAARVRKPEYLHFRDVTIRSCRDTGTVTELAKLREGLGKFYLYAQTSRESYERKKLAKWVLYDLDIARAAGVLEKDWPEKPNRDKDGRPDGTWFIMIPIDALSSAGAIVASHGHDVDERKSYPMPERRTSMGCLRCPGPMAHSKCTHGDA